MDAFTKNSVLIIQSNVKAEESPKINILFDYKATIEVQFFNFLAMKQSTSCNT